MNTSSTLLVGDWNIKNSHDIAKISKIIRYLRFLSEIRILEKIIPGTKKFAKVQKKWIHNCLNDPFSPTCPSDMVKHCHLHFIFHVMSLVNPSESGLRSKTIKNNIHINAYFVFIKPSQNRRVSIQSLGEHVHIINIWWLLVNLILSRV